MQLSKILALGDSLSHLDPKKTNNESLIKWLVQNLRENFHMLNCRLVHYTLMSKSTFYTEKSDNYIFKDTISRSKQHQLNKVLDALN